MADPVRLSPLGEKSDEFDKGESAAVDEQSHDSGGTWYKNEYFKTNMAF